MKSVGTAVFLALTFPLSYATAQEAVTASGGEASGSGGSVSYSIGQVFYITHKGANGTVTEGVQQSYEITVLTAIEDVDINLRAVVYPNPTTDYLNLLVDNIELSALNFQLFDNTGRILQNGKIMDRETNIAMSALVPATYFVRVVRGSTEVKTFKVIKK